MLVRHAQRVIRKVAHFFHRIQQIFFLFLLHFQTDIIAAEQLNCCRLILLRFFFLSFDLTTVDFFVSLDRKLKEKSNISFPQLYQQNEKGMVIREREKENVIHDVIC